MPLAMGFEWSLEAGTARMRSAFREEVCARAFWRGGWKWVDLVFGKWKWRFRAVQTHARYACRSMRSKYQAGLIVTRYQGSSPAGVLPAGSAGRSIAPPHALVLGNWDTAKR